MRSGECPLACSRKICGAACEGKRWFVPRETHDCHKPSELLARFPTAANVDAVAMRAAPQSFLHFFNGVESAVLRHFHQALFFPGSCRRSCLS
jgi:hypothetical protein